MKIKKVYYFIMLQLFFNTLFLIMGFYFKSDNNVVSSSILGMVTKVQCTNDVQNFIWLFTHNLTVMFLGFWFNYFTFGIVGTFWSINNAFMLGTLIKIYWNILDNAWLSILFVAIEFATTLITIFSSTYFRFEKTCFKKKFDNEFICSENYIIKKKAYEKNILHTFLLVTLLLLISAILETIVLHSI